MDARDYAPDQDRWLRNAHALRRLAASLVRDADEAADLVQDTWLRSGREERSRSWLSAVLRNLVRDRARERGRRAWTERMAARAERLPDSAEIAAELELAQRVAQEVAALEEPYRLALHLRYFEGLDLAEIAARCRLPLETVRTRQKRGLARLRERMDRASGRRDAWVGVLLPLIRRGAGFENAAASTWPTVVTSAIGAWMSTKLIGAAAAVILGALGLFLWRSPPASPSSPPPSALAESVARAIERALPAAGAVVSLREPVAPSGTAPSLLPAAGSLRKSEGTVVIVDERGEELASESGVLTVARGTSRSDYRLQDVAVEDGRFRLDLRAGEWLVFARLVARGREAVLPEPSPIVPGDQPLRVRGEWLKRGRIRVLDAVTRQELSGIEVRCSQGWRANPEWTHPGDDERIRTVVADASSPIDLPDRAWLTPYWVHAPGYAWARVDFDHKVGGERTLELSRVKSSLSVTLDGAVPAGAFVRLYAQPVAPPKPDARGHILLLPPFEDWPSWYAGASVRAAACGPTRIDDFDAGGSGVADFIVAVEVGEYEDRLRLGSAEVQIPAGGSAAVTVRVDGALLDVPRTHLFGTIRVPPGLDREACELRLKRLEGGEKSFTRSLSAMSYHRGENDTLRWDAGPMRTGTYLASFTSIQFRATIETRGPGQETEVELVIPPLVTVRVEVVDQATGAPLEAEIRWRGAVLPGVSESTLSKVQRNPSTGVLEFVASRGEVEVSTSLAGYRDATQELKLSGATASCRLELARATGIRISMREGDAALPVGLQYPQGIGVRDSNGESLRPYIQVAKHGTTIHLDEPGRYTLEFPPLEGFEPLEPRTIDVRPDEIVELVVVAVRKPRDGGDARP